MNRKQLILLIVLAAALGGLGWLAYERQQSSLATSKVHLGEKVLPNFPLNDVAQFTIKQPKAQLTMAKKGDVWGVVERDNYPANFQTISEFIRKFWELKVTKPVRVGASRLSALELQPPDKGNGTLVDFKDASGKPIKSVLLGAKHMREGGGESPMGMGGPGGGGFPDGRYLMVGTDLATVSLVNEPFANAEAKPAEWLQKDWFKVEKIKSISVTSGDATNNWKLSRESETGEWKLADLKSGENLDTGKSAGATSALSYPSFEDVVVGTNAAGSMEKPIVGNIETFDGYTYTVKVGKKEDEDKYHFQMDVAGNFPKERAPGKDEKPEDKDKLDKEFKEGLAKKEEKVKTEKAFAKWTYVVSKWTIDPFLKTRHELLAEKPAETKADAKPEATPSLPGGLTLPGGLPPLPPPPPK
jgi:hypothetical protein